MAETWTSLSEDAYKAALLLQQNERWRSMMSRAYYAVYARVAALLVDRGVTMPDGWEGPAHVLPGLIRTHLTYLDDRWAIAAWVTVLYEWRLKADYRPSATVDMNDVRNIVNLMRNARHRLREKKP